jgi:hypothetical protein
MEQGSSGKEVDDCAGDSSVSKQGVSVSGTDILEAVQRVALANYNLGAANTAAILGQSVPFGSPSECNVQAENAFIAFGELLVAFVKKAQGV